MEVCGYGDLTISNVSSPTQMLVNKHWTALSFGNKFSAALEDTYVYVTPTPSPTI
jgi:hypothetical protein